MLIWNAIVKNESAIIGRALASLLPHVDGAVVADTGSIDSTPELIESSFKAARKPIELHDIAFDNFAQARNAALEKARLSGLPWQFALLSDADMELVVNDGGWRDGAQHAAAYDMQQIAGGIAYWNRRLLGRELGGIYRAVTHEYLDVPTSGQVQGAYFIDHADGRNREGKFDRDIALLNEALQTETEPGLVQRYHYYLGQSYFDAGNWPCAADHYRKRVELGGWDEEVWNAQYRYAHCLDNMGDKPGYVWEMLRAYEMRPQRAEALYDLARSFREMGYANFRSLLFSEPGCNADRPNDMLFVNDYVYKTGLKEEFAICAYYDKARRQDGARMTDALSLSPIASEFSRAQARSNLYWYIEPLKEHVPSFGSARIEFDPPDGYVPMNPSAVMHDGALAVLVRTVNYRITPEGRYVSRTGEQVNGQDVIRTRNWLLRFENGVVNRRAEIELPLPMTLEGAPFPLVRGFEDSRLFVWRGQLWTLSTVRELTPEGWCEQVLAKLDHDGEKLGIGMMQRVAPKGPKRHEKNWMPFANVDRMQFVYRLGRIMDQSGEVLAEHDTRLAVDHMSGGSQAVEIEPDLWIALVHEAGQIPGSPLRFYQHRFVTMRRDGRMLALSAPFYFNGKAIEFAAGLAKDDGRDDLIISYGVRDEEAWLGRVRIDEVMRFCG